MVERMGKGRWDRTGGQVKMERQYDRIRSHLNNRMSPETAERCREDIGEVLFLLYGEVKRWTTENDYNMPSERLWDVLGAKVVRVSESEERERAREYALASEEAEVATGDGDPSGSVPTQTLPHEDDSQKIAPW